MYEINEAKRRSPNADFSKILAIIGIKNHELDESEWQYKGRVVFGGDEIHDGGGQWAIFDEVGSTPASMVVCCALVAG